jgi:hypothetical protein
MPAMDNFVPPVPVVKVVEAARAAVGAESVDYRFTVFPATNGDELSGLKWSSRCASLNSFSQRAHTYGRFSREAAFLVKDAREVTFQMRGGARKDPGAPMREQLVLSAPTKPARAAPHAPYTRGKASKKWTADKKAAFIAALRADFAIAPAAKRAGVSRSTVYMWRAEDDDFAEAWDDAREAAVDVLERTLYKRAIRHDTVAGIFLLKGARPHIYRDRYEVTGPGGGPLISVVLRPDEDVP